ncbi:MAG: heavy-metal-associated domain-containing protein [Candidatus Latescibacteria bacterium]|nr:heavy-metal-associated domain-containing protein [Candidatus Latescibacterota bacterium]
MFRKIEKHVLTVEGMTCGHCEQRVVRSVTQVAGVEKVTASHQNHAVEIVFKKGELPDLDAIRQTITELGFRVQ